MLRFSSETFGDSLRSIDEHKESMGRKRQQMASPFRMSNKNYKPRVAEQVKEDLQRSIMGISFKDIGNAGGQSSLRESLIKPSPRKSTIKWDQINVVN